jgi:exopolyphosphatase/guanosine-5'-triphosphate,3'-diphosphate pyrophosphatase
MTGERIAVIDLGSNTFHLLICEITEDKSWTVIYKKRIYVKLASGGVDQIDVNSARRGLTAMRNFSSLIKSHGVSRTKSIATAALREATNGMSIAKKFTSATGLAIDIIDGQREAGYILKGIQAALPPLDRNGLIMDIGGGSVEFILFKGNTISFKESYKIGVAILHKRFHLSDPISAEEITTMENHLGETLCALIQSIQSTGAYYLIGASGSFEVINDILAKYSESTHWSELDTNGMDTYLTKIIGTSIAERRQIPEIPLERIDYIVVAFILIRFVFRHIPPEKLFYCDFALKEGVLVEMVEEW